MSSELSLRSGHTVAAELQWANQMAAADLIPGQYRGRPSNIIWAKNYAESLGLHPMVAITGIYVIDGKPTASAALISALVRRAGHKLRVVSKTSHATAQIIRHDDPDFVFEVTWELYKNDRGNPSAELAQLLDKKNWAKYPASMLPSRAITQCARMACEEALMGIHYTPEELGAVVNEDGIPVQVERLPQATYQDLLAPQIMSAQALSTLEKYHRDATAAGVLDLIPQDHDVTILSLLNTRAKVLVKQEQDKIKQEDRFDGTGNGTESAEAEHQAVGDEQAAGHQAAEVVDDADPEIVSIHENDTLTDD